jgi:hypothetical protein
MILFSLSRSSAGQARWSLAATAKENCMQPYDATYLSGKVKSRAESRHCIKSRGGYADEFRTERKQVVFTNDLS